MFYNNANIKMIQSPILLLSSGRTGSTLIQRIINTSENIVMWGEHNGMLSGIARSYFNILYSKPINDFHYSRLDEISPSLIEHSYSEYNKVINWLNSFDKIKTKELYQSFIFSLLNQEIRINEHQKWGFKEICYTNQDRTVDMFFDLFPETKIIFSIRNPLDEILSMMFAFYSEAARESAFTNNDIDRLIVDIHKFAQRINIYLTSFVQWRQELGSNSIIIRYEDLIEQKKETTSNLFKFLDEDIPTNAFEPFNYILESTKNEHFHSEMKNLIKQESSTIFKILSVFQNEFNYQLNP
jgi:hypothetical protein